MQKQAPSIGRIMVAVGFALSCFALLLFLWVTFGGPVPFKPESYRFTADFPEAITLQKEAEVRIGGVTVGHVKSLELPPDGNSTRAVIEVEPKYAPISSDSQAILRQKTLLGETYVELTTGSQTAPQEEGGSSDTTTAQAGAIDLAQVSGDDAVHPIEEGGHLEQSQVADQTQIDEIFNGFDEQTRQAFQLWMKNAGIGINGRGLDLNDAFGNIGPFSDDASDVLQTLREQEQSLRSVVRNTGTVFQALTARDQALAGAIVGTNRTFRALASRDSELAEVFRIFPTFNSESRLTLERLQDFAHNAGPLFHDLRPVARDLSPTLHDLRRLAPHARRVFNNLDPLIKASATGLPALRDFLDRLRPTLAALDPFLANFNPILRYLYFYRTTVADFLANPSAATAGSLPCQSPMAPGCGQPNARHLSRQMSIFNAETLSIYPTRLATNRGNPYLLPGAIANPRSASEGGVFPSLDCNNTGSNRTDNEVLLSGPAPPAFNDSSYSQEGGYYPFSNQVPPTAPHVPAIAPSLPPPLNTILGPLGGAVPFTIPDLQDSAAFATCDIQSKSVGSFPAAFGGAACRRYCLIRRILPTQNGRSELAYFKDAQDVYDTIGKLFEDLAEDDELAPKFRKANTIVQYQYRDPEATITLRLQEDQPGDVDLGETQMEPEVEMSMEADTAHRFFLGKVNVTVALARGQIKAKGPVAKILKLVPLTKPIFPRYKAQLESQGREDLVNVD